MKLNRVVFSGIVLSGLASGYVSAQDDGARYRYIAPYSSEWYENGWGGNFVSDQGQIFKSIDDYPTYPNGQHRLGVCEGGDGELLLNRGFMQCGLVSSLNLSGRDLRGRYPVGVLVKNSNLTGADLRNANLHDSYFLNSSLSHANMLSNNLHRSYWVNVSAAQTVFGLSNFFVQAKHNPTVESATANMRGAKFNSAKLRFTAENIDLTGADFYRVGNSDFARLNPVDNYLIGKQVILNGAAFNEAKMRLDINASNISGYLVQSSAKSLIAKNADLSGSTFKYVDMSGSQFQNTSLEGSTFVTVSVNYGYPARLQTRITDISNSNFQGANLKTTTLYANFDAPNHYFMPARNSNFRNADFQYARLKHVDLSGSDLSMADLRGALLCKVEARSANFNGTKLAGAMISADTALPFSLDEARARGATIISPSASSCAFNIY